MSSMWSLPEEIQVDIFLRLPVNSIVTCRCVCKPLCSLLSKPSFIKNHLNRSIQTNNPRLMFGRSRYDQRKNPIIISVDYKSISLSAVSEVKVVLMDYPFEERNTKAIAPLGSCNGLICFGVSSYRNGIDQKNRICVWNPTTGEYTNIELALRCKSSYFFRYGFGYDSNTDDYKLVAISGYENCPGKKIEVYRLGSKCWRTLQSTDPYIFLGSRSWKAMESREPCIFSGHLHESPNGVFINGVLHWSGAMVTTEGTSTKLIVCFDINKERIMDVPFPEETMLPLDEQHQKMYREVGVLGDCLSVVFSVVDIRTDVWVMQDYGVRESWTKVFTTTQERITRDPFFKPIWSFENGEILVYACDQLSLYDEYNGETRKVLFHGVNMSRYPESYVESLVSLKARTYVEKKDYKWKLEEAQVTKIPGASAVYPLTGSAQDWERRLIRHLRITKGSSK